MRIVVTAPNGHVGRRVVSRLLDGGARVVLFARNPNKIKDLAAKGGSVVVGDLRDPATIVPSLDGADALFWLTPPDPITDDPRGHQRKLGAAAAAAIRESGVRRVVNLSSIGAQLDSGTGPIAGLHDVEELLDGTGAHVTHLRAAYFMENAFFSLETIRMTGRIFLPVSGGTAVPRVATRDVALVAARALLDASWEGRRVQGIHGPADLTFSEAAHTMGRELGRPVEHVTVTPSEAKEMMVSTGLSPRVTDAYLEMYDSMETGRLVVAEKRTAETTTPTTLETFTREEMLPLL